MVFSELEDPVVLRHIMSQLFDMKIPSLTSEGQRRHVLSQKLKMNTSRFVKTSKMPNFELF